MSREVLKTYMDHFLPREIIGPVVIVFALEGVISGLFDLYVPQEYATMAWGVIFLLSVWIVAKWGTSGEASEQLEQELAQVRENE